MDKKKWIKACLTAGFILLAGMCYSCRGTNKEEPQITLLGETTQLVGEDVQAGRDVRAGDEVQAGKDVRAGDEVQAGEDGNKLITVDSVKLIYVHICGAVNTPDVYEVGEKTRIIDVIKLAGGLRDDAAGDYVNQASLVEDGQQIFIPTKIEVEGMTPTSTFVDKEDAISKVNINSATMEDLMTLSGIGEAKAKSIITYRQDNGAFKAIEEIMNIDGIKNSVFNKISDMITVN